MCNTAQNIEWNTLPHRAVSFGALLLDLLLQHHSLLLQSGLCCLPLLHLTDIKDKVRVSCSVDVILALAEPVCSLLSLQ